MTLTPEIYFLLLLIPLFYVNHLWIFGLAEVFFVEYNNDKFPKEGRNKDGDGLLWFVNVWCRTKYDVRVCKPLFLCQCCMASVHSSYFYWPIALTFFNFHTWMIPLYFVYAIALTGFNNLRQKKDK